MLGAPVPLSRVRRRGSAAAAFVNEVNALERSGRLDQTTATGLVGGAQLIQASLGCP
jgi:hypothetical protein